MAKKIFVDEIDNYDFCVNTMKIEKSFRKDFDNRIKQLCEDFCDQADERKFFYFCEHVKLHHGPVHGVIRVGIFICSGW